jgi:hypothetical protein
MDFSDDPLTPIFTASDPEIGLLLFKSGIGSAAIAGLLHVLVVPSPANGEGKYTPSQERIIGVAVRFPEGVTPNATAEQRAAGWDAFIATTEKKIPTLKAWWMDSVGLSLVFLPSAESNSWPV